MKNHRSYEWRGDLAGLPHPPKFIAVLWFSILLLLAVGARSQGTKGRIDIPHLQTQGATTQLLVGNRPFLMLGGELGNSTASSLEYMRPLWPRLAQMHLNTVLVPVYWELLEPAEGRFEFTLIDSALHAARRHDLKLVFLWFGSWKNSMSCYARWWVKTDPRRFPRARSKNGEALEILTPFSDENRNADARAFTALMHHLRLVDGEENTVLMMQVENEIGMIPDARDYSESANRAFAAPVPSELLAHLQKHRASLMPELRDLWQATGFKSSGSWEQVFGTSLQTDEVFMAWHFARYAGYVTQAGKAEYPLPMYVNAALIRPNYLPGQYPSAGPLPHLMEVWRAAAPQIDFAAPDIYFQNFAEWCEKYVRSGNPLFIPEVGNNQSVANAFYAFARHDAMGFSPFSIESIELPAADRIANGYDVLQQISPLILANQGKGTMVGVLLDSMNQKVKLRLGDYTFTARHEYSWKYAARTETEPPRVGGLIIALAPDEFLVAGSGIIVTFGARAPDGAKAGIARIDEGRWMNGNWIPGRRLNGDQSHQGRHLHLPGSSFGIQRVRLYKYQ